MVLKQRQAFHFAAITVNQYDLRNLRWIDYPRILMRIHSRNHQSSTRMLYNGKSPFNDQIIMCIPSQWRSIGTHNSKRYEEMHRVNAAINKFTCSFICCSIVSAMLTCTLICFSILRWLPASGELSFCHWESPYISCYIYTVNCVRTCC